MNQTNPPTVAYKTFGCRLNQAETARYASAFDALGFARAPIGPDASVIVVHSCTVTRKAEHECVKFLRHFRTACPWSCLVLTGCAVGSIPPDELKTLADVIVPNSQKEQLPTLVFDFWRRLHPEAVLPAPVPAVLRPRTQRALLKVQDGCAFRCAYCIVPDMRGAPRSRPFGECLEEARALIGEGFQELIVTGCNTACYNDNGKTLPNLIDALLALPGLGRIRLGSIEPGTIEREIAGRMAADPRLCRFLHLPIQSGDDAILERMGRHYRADDLRQTFDFLYAKVPGLALGTDIITGFPGETEDAFANTCSLLFGGHFANVHSFPYSERPGTPAATFPGAVPDKTRRRRTARLIKLAAVWRAAYARRFVGKPVQMLVEHFDEQGNACGWSGEYLPCAVSGIPACARRTLVNFVPAATDGERLLGACR